MTVAFALASVIAAASPTQVVDAGDIAREVGHALRARLDAAGSSATIDLQGRIADQAVPAGSASIVVGEIAGPLVRQRIAVPVRLQVEGRTVRTLVVNVLLRDERQVLSYASDAAPGTAAVEGTPTRIDMTCCTGTTVSRMDDVAGMRLRRSVRRGAPVLREDFEAMPDVRRHDVVEVEIRRGAVRIVVPGTALRDANIGDLVDVRTTASAEVLRARVVAQRQVAIE